MQENVTPWLTHWSYVFLVLTHWDNGLEPDRQQAITWTSDDPANWYIYIYMPISLCITLESWWCIYIYITLESWWCIYIYIYMSSNLDFHAYFFVYHIRVLVMHKYASPGLNVIHKEICMEITTTKIIVGKIKFAVSGIRNMCEYTSWSLQDEDRWDT